MPRNSSDTRQTSSGLEDLGLDKIYGFQEGKIVSPDDLGVGEYTLTVVAEFDGSTRFENSIQLFMDPSESAACTE